MWVSGGHLTYLQPTSYYCLWSEKVSEAQNPYSTTTYTTCKPFVRVIEKEFNQSEKYVSNRSHYILVYSHIYLFALELLMRWTIYCSKAARVKRAELLIWRSVRRLFL